MYRAMYSEFYDADIGSRAFTILWLFPVSIFVGLVSIQNISAFWPGLVSQDAPLANSFSLITVQKRYLDKHAWEEEVIQSFIPTLLLAVLAILVPLVLRELSEVLADHSSDWTISSDREESTYDHNIVCFARSYYDPILQVPRRQRPGVFLCRHGGSPVVLTILQVYNRDQADTSSVG